MAAITIGILAGLLPALFWLWFWLKEDAARPEPRGLIAQVFLAGALMILPAYILEKFLGAGVALPDARTWIGLIIITVWATIEESLKFAAAYVFALRTHFYDEPVDAIIYLITAALGFAAGENILFIINTIFHPGAGAWDYLLTGNFRFLGASLLHLTASAAIGVALGLSYRSKPAKEGLWTALGLGIAIGLHAIFNYFIIKSDSGQLLPIFGFLWLTGVILILLFERVKQAISQKNS